MNKKKEYDNTKSVKNRNSEKKKDESKKLI